MTNDNTPAPIGADARSSFIRWYAGFLLSDEMHAAHVWDNNHIPAQAWRAALASAAQPADFDEDRAMRAQAAPAAVAEPVAWLHDDPQRYDVIHAEVKDLLVKSRDAAGHLHRPLDKSAHYTIPLYTAPAPAAQGDAEDAARWRVINEQFIDDYLEDYELIGEAEGVGDCCYTPTETERELIKDAVLGLLSCAEDAARAQAKEGASNE